MNKNSTDDDFMVAIETSEHTHVDATIKEAMIFISNEIDSV